MLGAVNVVKNGATVVLKFEVLAGASKLSDVSVVEAFTVGEVACATLDLTANELPIDQLSTAQTALRYDTTAGQFVQHWRTPKKASACYRVTLATKDGSSLVAYFQLR
jgi:hypothetical protein